MTKIGHVAAQRRADRLKRLKGALSATPEPPQRPLAVTVQEFADLTGLGVATVWRALRDGQLKHKKFRNRVVIPYSEAARIVGIEP
jgi:excisionase family DNA binding protein